MSDPDHVSQPGDHHGPYNALSDDELKAAYERVAADPDNVTAPMFLAELEARGIAAPLHEEVAPDPEAEVGPHGSTDAEP